MIESSRFQTIFDVALFNVSALGQGCVCTYPLFAHVDAIGYLKNSFSVKGEVLW